MLLDDLQMFRHDLWMICKLDHKPSLNDQAVQAKPGLKLQHILASQPATHPAAGRPAADRPAAGRPAAGRQAAGRPAAGRPAAGRPAAGRPTAVFNTPLVGNRPFDRA